MGAPPDQRKSDADPASPTNETESPSATPECEKEPGVAPQEAFDQPNRGCFVEVGNWDRVLQRAERNLMSAFGPECSDEELLDCTVDCDDGDLGACVRLVNTRLRSPQVDLSRALAPLQDACAEADADACYAMGLIALHGLAGVPKNRSLAHVYQRWACDYGQATSCGILGHMHRNGGDEIEQDSDLGYSLLRKGCRMGSPVACNDYGYSLVGETWGKPREPDRALRLFVFSCERGSAFGCSSLAEALERGWGVAPDPKWALTFWSLQCTHYQHPEACAAVKRLK